MQTLTPPSPGILQYFASARVAARNGRARIESEGKNQLQLLPVVTLVSIHSRLVQSITAEVEMVCL